MIEIRKSKIHGKGVFATQFIPKNTILKCDVLLVDKNSKEFEVYYYPWETSKNLKCICIGFGSFFNSNEEPNVRIKSIDKEKLTKSFIILYDIKVNEELFLKYNL